MVSLPLIWQRVAEYYNVPVRTITDNYDTNRSFQRIRAVAYTVAQRLDYSKTEIAKSVGRYPSTITEVVNQTERLTDNDSTLEHTIRKLMA